MKHLNCITSRKKFDASATMMSVAKTEKEERIEYLEDVIAKREENGNVGSSRESHESFKKQLHELKTTSQERLTEAKVALEAENASYAADPDNYYSFHREPHLFRQEQLKETITREEAEIAGKSTAPSQKTVVLPTSATSPIGYGGVIKPFKSPLETGVSSSTESHLDPNSDIPRLVNPLDPHPDFSGEVPRIVNPLKPGPKMPMGG